MSNFLAVVLFIFHVDYYSEFLQTGREFSLHGSGLDSVVAFGKQISGLSELTVKLVGRLKIRRGCSL